MSSKKPQIQLEQCPRCHKTEDVGFLGGSSLKKFFCSGCCIEFTVKESNKGKHIKSYDISAGGTI